MAQIFQSLVHHVEVVRDFFVKPNIPIPTCFGDPDGNRIGMDIESNVVYLVVHENNLVRRCAVFC
jgi:hypothetical protein